VKCLAFSPNGAWLASGSADHTIRLWECRTGQLKTILKGHSQAVLCLAFSRSGKLLASGSADETVRFWSIEESREQAPVLPRANQGPILALAFSPDGCDLAIVTCDLVDVWTHAPPRRRYMIEAPERGSIWWNARYLAKGVLLGVSSGARYVRDVRVSAKKGLRGGSHQPNENEIRVWDTMTHQDCGWFDGHYAPVKAVDVSANGVLLASGSSDKTVRLWHVAADQKLDPPPSDGDELSASDEPFRPAWDSPSAADELCGWDCSGGILFEGSVAIRGPGAHQRGRVRTGKGHRERLTFKETLRDMDPSRYFDGPRQSFVHELRSGLSSVLSGGGGDRDGKDDHDHGRR
jgi:WD40 repeat protein